MGGKGGGGKHEKGQRGTGEVMEGSKGEGGRAM